MNKIFNYSIALLFLLIAFSCKKTFEDHPLDFVSEDYIWDQTDPTGTYAQNFLTRIYAQLPIGYNRLNGEYLECVSDDAVPSNSGNATWNVINGGYSPSSTFDDNWSNSYSGIRNVNLFLANYKRIPWADPTRPRWFAAEARTLRAFFYYELIKRYGGVPLLGDKVFSSTDPSLFTIKRNSFDTCVNYIVSELTSVQDSLRPEATLAARGSGNGTTNGTDADGGRIRKSVVLAIKAKVLLLAASPLFNPSSTPDKDYTGYPTYSVTRWKAAADAAMAVMDLKDPVGANMFVLETNRYMLNLTRVNKEVIWERQGGGTSNSYAWDMSPVGFNVSSKVSTGAISPTQELVNAFPMKNGKAITDATSGYDPNNPYTNRDPRLNQTVFYNGATWLKRAVETFEGGKDKPNNSSISSVQTLTGYYSKKFLADDGNNTTYTATSLNPYSAVWVYIRYAEILLMHAESLNEYSGPDASVYSDVEAIRQRAGLVPYALPIGLTQSQMRDVIHNERRIEFAFEEQRFWDIRRWKIAPTVYGIPLHGVTIVKNANGTFTYILTTVATPYFIDAMNLLPIQLNETMVNPNMKQNPGY
jgi:hypothetical protein